MSYLYISHSPTWCRERPFVAMQVGGGWWHRFMSPTFATLPEAVAWARKFCQSASCPFSLLGKDELPSWFHRIAHNPQAIN